MKCSFNSDFFSPLLLNILFFFYFNISGEVLKPFLCCCNKSNLLFHSEDVCKESYSAVSTIGDQSEQ